MSDQQPEVPADPAAPAPESPLVPPMAPPGAAPAPQAPAPAEWNAAPQAPGPLPPAAPQPAWEAASPQAPAAPVWNGAPPQQPAAPLPPPYAMPETYLPGGSAAQAPPAATAPMSETPGLYGGAPGYGPAAPYAAPQFPQYAAAVTTPLPPQPKTTGVIALLLSLLVVIGGSVMFGLSLFQIGAHADQSYIDRYSNDFSLNAFIPVRGWVLTAEITFWTGLVLGIAAIVFGIVAIAGRRGRGLGVAAIVVTVLGSGLIAGVAFVSLAIGLGVGMAGY